MTVGYVNPRGLVWSKMLNEVYLVVFRERLFRANLMLANEGVMFPEAVN